MIGFGKDASLVQSQWITGIVVVVVVVYWLERIVFSPHTSSFILPSSPLFLSILPTLFLGEQRGNATELVNTLWKIMASYLLKLKSAKCRKKQPGGESIEPLSTIQKPGKFLNLPVEGLNSNVLVACAIKCSTCFMYFELGFMLLKT